MISLPAVCKYFLLQKKKKNHKWMWAIYAHSRKGGLTKHDQYSYVLLTCSYPAGQVSQEMWHLKKCGAPIQFLLGELAPFQENWNPILHSLPKNSIQG